MANPPQPPDHTQPPDGQDNTPPTTSSRVPSRSANPTEQVVERTRAWTGMWVVVGGDVAIAVAAILGVVKFSSTTASSSALVAILTSAFTAIGTMTTAYFGIRSSANTAQRFTSSSRGTQP